VLEWRLWRLRDSGPNRGQSKHAVLRQLGYEIDGLSPGHTANPVTPPRLGRTGETRPMMTVDRGSWCHIPLMTALMSTWPSWHASNAPRQILTSPSALCP
jgi:hypothetical protein